MSGERVEREDGGYAILLEDDEGNIEITEYDAEGNFVQSTIGRSENGPADAAERDEGPPAIFNLGDHAYFAVGDSDLPRGDVEASRADKRLQRGKAVRESVEWVRGEAGEVACPDCGSTELAWFAFESPPWTWQHLCGSAGVIAWCDACDRQVGYAELAMN